MLILGGNSDEGLHMTLKCLPNRLFINCKGEQAQLLYTGEIRQHFTRVANMNITDHG